MNRGRIIVIDDDPALLATVRRALASLHDVEIFSSGRAAIERLRGGDPVDVILCDLIMPELGGAEVYAEIERTIPDLCSRIIFSTGGAFTEQARNFLGSVGNRQLEKPFDVPHLRAIVQEALENNR
jgi:CheY-like chemotaxis protein